MITTIAAFIALAIAVLTAISHVLHVIAPHTQTTVDDRLAAFADKAENVLMKLEAALATAGAQP